MPAYGIPTAISEDGKVAALLWEKNPDEAHLNNRSATLVAVGSKGKVERTPLVKVRATLVGCCRSTSYARWVLYYRCHVWAEFQGI